MNTSHTKLYLSLAQTRAYDGPIGDPFGGPAYGERAMPVAVVALAAGSFAAGAAAFTAAAAWSATAVLAGTLMVGSALTIVGTITGNQNLTKIGGALALIGGGGLAIESLMSSAAEGAAGAAGAAAGETGAAGMESGFGGAMPDAPGVTGVAQTSSVPMPDVTTTVGGEAMAAAPEIASQAAPVAQGLVESAIPAQEITATADSWSNFATPEAMLNPAGQSLNMADPLAQGVDQAQKLAGMDGNGMITSGFDKFGKWVGENKELAKIGTQAIAGMAGNLIPSDKDKAMTDYYQATADRTRATTDDEKRRAAWRRGLINY